MPATKTRATKDRNTRKKSSFKSATSWRSKLEKAQDPVVCPIPDKMARRLGPGTLLIPTPLQVDAVVRTIPKGKLTTSARIRAKLAQDHDATTACPLCTGIFLRISAEASEEDAASGRKDVTPYWRVVGEDGALHPKFPGGPESQARRLRAEGHKMVRSPRGKLRVARVNECLSEL